MSEIITGIMENFLAEEIEFYQEEYNEMGIFGGGVMITKEIDDARWRVEVTSVALSNEDALSLIAKLRRTRGSRNLLEIYDFRRPNPILHSSVVDTSFQIGAQTFDGETLTIKGLPNGFTLSEGDYFSVHTASSSYRFLYQCMEKKTESSGIISKMKVTPTVSQAVGTNDAVRVMKPKGYFRMIPNSLRSERVSHLSRKVSFSAIQDYGNV